ncbi:hypothetical protein BB561_001471 [Smittium simulii]|uniref:Uncharacterized protein n=1 Tax=Smittium simulii TaxID=133385 RepID=A0A2T9YUI5_9FUNG|nr:hypothetical protein BB561_001471 [Smittium simulii]
MSPNPVPTPGNPTKTELIKEHPPQYIKKCSKRKLSTSSVMPTTPHHSQKKHQNYNPDQIPTNINQNFGVQSQRVVDKFVFPKFNPNHKDFSACTRRRIQRRKSDCLSDKSYLKLKCKRNNTVDLMDIQLDFLNRSKPITNCGFKQLQTSTDFLEKIKFSHDSASSNAFHDETNPFRLENKKLYQIPPINRSTLSELGIKRILVNPRLRHEIVFEKKLEFKPKLPNGTEKTKNELSNNYWNKLEKDIKNYNFFKYKFPALANPGTIRIFNLIIEIKGILLDIFEDIEFKPDMYKFSQKFEPSSLLYQIKTGNFAGDDLISYTTDILKDISAPTLHSKIDKIINCTISKNYTKAFRECLACLEIIKMDIANKAIESYRGYLKSTSVIFEKTQFENSLKCGKIDQPCHKKWWDNLYNKYKSAHSSYFNIFLAGFYENLFSESYGLPDLFSMDETRILGFKSQSKLLCISGCLMLGIKQFFSSNQLTLQQNLKDLINFLISVSNPNAPLAKLVSNKIQAAFVNLIAGIDDKPMQTLTSLGLQSFSLQIHSTLKSASPVLEHHWSVYGSYYQGL